MVREILAAPEHTWLDGLPAAEAEAARKHYKTYFDMPLPGADK